MARVLDATFGDSVLESTRIEFILVRINQALPATLG